MLQDEQSSVCLVQLSDLHFGAKNQLEVWKSLKKWLCDSLKPNLVLVTGDIVDSPDKNFYKKAENELEALKLKYYVCAGNHDHHWKGNAWRGLTKRSGRFKEYFSNKCPFTDHPFILELGDSENKWKLMLFTLDSSENSKYSAQGFLSIDSLENISSAMLNADGVDIVIVLVHHHLLPIPARETSIQDKPDFLKLTTMLNAGLLLEKLVREHVDIVLHGHEHCYNAARYGTLSGTEVVVLGAGSATGAKTLKPCSINEASLNLIELRRDRSVWIQEVNWKELHEWSPKGHATQLYDRDSLKRLSFLRRFKDREVPSSKIVKNISFTHRRDGIVRECRTDWVLRPPKFKIKAINSTGEPVKPRVRADFGYGMKSLSGNTSGNDSGFCYLRDEDHAWGCEFSLTGFGANSSSVLRAKQLEIEYVWENGALLCREDLSLLKHTAPGPLRREGLEFGGVIVDHNLRSVTLCVTIQKPYVPKFDETFVYVQSKDDRDPVKNLRLSDTLETNGEGVFTLSVAYPEAGNRYYIAWKVPPKPELTPTGRRFADKAISNGTEFAQFVGNKFQDSALPENVVKNCSFALYVEGVDKGKGEDKPCYSLKRVGEWFATQETRVLPPGEILLSSERNLLLHALWGKSNMAIDIPIDPQLAADAGLSQGEEGLATAPIGITLDGEGAAPWAILRVGIIAGAGYRDLSKRDMNAQALHLKSVLKECIFALINKFLREEQ